MPNQKCVRQTTRAPPTAPHLPHTICEQPAPVPGPPARVGRLAKWPPRPPKKSARRQARTTPASPRTISSIRQSNWHPSPHLHAHAHEIRRTRPDIFQPARLHYGEPRSSLLNIDAPLQHERRIALENSFEPGKRFWEGKHLEDSGHVLQREDGPAISLP